MNERIKQLRNSLHKSQEEFGKFLGLSKSGVSEIEAGRRKVTDQHVIMLRNCSDFNLNEEWLRTGEGEMFIDSTREEEIADFTLKLLKEEPDSFKNRLVSVLSRMTEEEWEMLERKLREIMGDK